MDNWCLQQKWRTTIKCCFGKCYFYGMFWKVNIRLQLSFLLLLILYFVAELTMQTKTLTLTNNNKFLTLGPYFSRLKTLHYLALYQTGEFQDAIFHVQMKFVTNLVYSSENLSTLGFHNSIFWYDVENSSSEKGFYWQRREAGLQFQRRYFTVLIIVCVYLPLA